jgi:hypothetical protein
VYRRVSRKDVTESALPSSEAVRVRPDTLTDQPAGTSNRYALEATVVGLDGSPALPHPVTAMMSASATARLRARGLGNGPGTDRKDDREMKTKDALSDVRPYVERAVKDEDLRDNVLAAFQAAREVYNELIGDRGVTTIAARVATDKDIQEKLREAVDELREAADRVQGKKDTSGRNSMLLLLGITLGILFNPMTGPATRQWLKEKVLGPSDDFTYSGGGNSSPTT